MKRVLLAVLTLTCAGVGIPNATAGQVIPLHSLSATTVVHGSVRSVVVDADYGAIKLGVGTTITVSAHEAWNFQQPVITISLTKGVLSVKADCRTHSSAGAVDVVGLGDTANDCFDDLTITLPASVIISATSSQGDVVSTGFRAAQRLHSDTGAVQVARATGSTIDASSNSSDVSVNDVRSTSIIMHSDQGALKLTQAQAKLVVLSTSTSNVVVSHLTAEQLDVESSQGAVTLSDSTLAATVLASNTSSLTVSNTSSPVLDLTTLQGQISTTGVRAARIMASTETADISLSTVTKPDRLVARSNQGAITIDLPSDRYAVVTSTNQGTIRVGGLTVDPHSSRHLEAHTNTSDITITGH